MLINLSNQKINAALKKLNLQWYGFLIKAFVSTEVYVFHRNGSKGNEVVLKNEKVLKNMKIIGLIYDSKPNWYHQIVTAIEKANKAKQAFYFKIFLHSRNSKIVNCTFLQ